MDDAQVESRVRQSLKDSEYVQEMLKKKFPHLYKKSPDSRAPEFEEVEVYKGKGKEPNAKQVKRIEMEGRR